MGEDTPLTFGVSADDLPRPPVTSAVGGRQEAARSDALRRRAYPLPHPGKAHRAPGGGLNKCGVGPLRGRHESGTVGPCKSGPSADIKPLIRRRIYKALVGPFPLGRMMDYARAEAAAYGQCGSTHHLTSGLTPLGRTPIRTVRLLDNTTSSCGASHCRAVGPFALSDATPGVYLHHRSELGEFILCSDLFIATFTRWKSTRKIVELFSGGRKRSLSPSRLHNWRHDRFPGKSN